MRKANPKQLLYLPLSPSLVLIFTCLTFFSPALFVYLNCYLSLQVYISHEYVCLVVCGHTSFCKRGKDSGNFFYSSLFCRSVQCRDQSQRSILSHTYHNFNRKLQNFKSTVKPQAAALSVFSKHLSGLCNVNK